MANKKKFAGILALALIFAMALIGCQMATGGGGSGNDDGDDSGTQGKTDPALNGTWRGTSTVSLPGEDGLQSVEIQVDMVMDNGSFEFFVISINSVNNTRTPLMKGSYTTNGDQLTMTISGMNGAGLVSQENKYCTKDEYETAYKARMKEYYEHQGLSGAELTAAVDKDYAEFVKGTDVLFQPVTSTYLVSGNTLTRTTDDYKQIFTKQ